jgi:tetratricopeptide (TPR) repeat protein
MKLSQARTGLLFLVVLTATTSGCGVVNRIRAKNALNEGARAYRDGRFAEAQEKFEAAYQLDPSQENAPLFIARAIQQQYRPGVTTPENLAKASAAIEAYKRVLATNPGNEDAFNAVAYLYRQMKDEDKETDWLTQRANLATAPKEKRSDAYTVLASKQWNCVYDITDRKENKETVKRPDAVIVRYKKPQNQQDFDQARGCALKGLELAEQAIALNPSNPSAWSYKTNLLREMAKLAEMENNADEKSKYDQEAEKALAEHTKLSEEAQARKRAEEEAKKSQTAPKS